MKNHRNTPRWYAPGDFARRHRRASDPQCTPAELIRLASDDEWVVRFAVAGNPASPSSAIAVLTTDKWPGLARFAKTHPSCPPSCRGGQPRSR